MITSTGSGLDIVIASNYTFQENWMTFSSWYSILKNIPDANAIVICARNKNTPQFLYGWPYKVGVKLFQHQSITENPEYRFLNKLYSVYMAVKHNFVKKPFLVVSADTLAIRELNSSILESLNEEISFGKSADDAVWYFKNIDNGIFVKALCELENCLNFSVLEKFVEPILLEGLCSESVSEDITVFSQVKERCGNYLKNEHQESLPLQYSFRFRTKDLSKNERKIFDFWYKMVPLFQAASS